MTGMQKRIEIMDTTLRDGEQTDGVSFSSFEKLQIARYLLDQLNVDRIEVASARVSRGEFESVREIFNWAREKDKTDRIEILGFVDYNRSVDWIGEAGGSVINLLTKGSRKHCEQQLGKSLSQHLVDIEKTIVYARSARLQVHVYLEDWSNGMLSSPDYVFELLSGLTGMEIRRFLLPDTLGILAPHEVSAFIGEITRTFPDRHFDFHGHNDYGLATANCLAAVQAGVSGLHVAVNGLGERAGNSPLETVVTALHDKLGVRTGVNEKAIMDASRLVETFSGKRIASNRPVVGQDVYTQTAGIHADGDKKNNLYANPISPERFGRERVYALGKLSGKASLSQNLKALGIELSAEREALLLKRIIELGEQKNLVTRDDLPFLMLDLFGKDQQAGTIQIVDAEIRTSLHERPQARLTIAYEGQTLEAQASGDGGYNAFMNALALILPRIGQECAELIDYEVRIPPGGQTDALVETVITWRYSGESKTFRTVGVDPDQIRAAIKATERMLNHRIALQTVERDVLGNLRPFA
ncbi:MAG: 2-isopropylmalate synthase [Spirochaetales bacterium]|nr:2-isopropylmalate synthase [Spirochaetales bacterium]